MQYYRLEKQARKIAFFSQGVAQMLLPASIFRKQLNSLLNGHDHEIEADIKDRLDYYNRIEQGFRSCDDAISVGSFKRDESWTYYLDMQELARFFPPDRRFCYLFGDVTDVPPCPTFVKSRPITANNHNAVLLKLDKLRHFNFVNDPFPFTEKLAKGLWRGKAHNAARRAFINQYLDNPLFDVGDVSRSSRGQPIHRPYMSINQQLKHRFIFSIEGNDVATNLKWIMSSNSLCLMPRPKYESWFMEGRLIPDHHYVLVRDDFADAEDKIRYYTRHPDEAQAIINNAHAYVDQFRDPLMERRIALRVMQKYFAASGQL